MIYHRVWYEIRDVYPDGSYCYTGPFDNRDGAIEIARLRAAGDRSLRSVQVWRRWRDYRNGKVTGAAGSQLDLTVSIEERG